MAFSKKSEIPIGGRIRATRLARDLTLGQVAAAAGLTQGFVSKLERDQVSPSVASLVSVCEALGLRVGDLFDAPVNAIVRAGDGAQTGRRSGHARRRGRRLGDGTLAAVAFDELEGGRFGLPTGRHRGLRTVNCHRFPPSGALHVSPDENRAISRIHA